MSKITSQEQLRELYGYPKGRAADKQLPALEKHSINIINKSPFVLISTSAKSGRLDCSPRGGEPGFVKVLNNNKIIIPDSKGNNRLDSLVNIVETGEVGLLFLLPGMDETLRVNGDAHISIDSEFLNLFSDERNPPKSVVEITITEVFLHCAKSLMRSKLWDSSRHIQRSDLPTIGQMMSDQLSDTSKIESQEEMEQRYKESL